MGEALIVTTEPPYCLADTLVLISFHEVDLLVLSQHQIHANEKYEVGAKSWTSAVATVLGSKLYMHAVHQSGAATAGGASS
ncbi:hypothetical protein Hanom_Chr04g00341061 [Helianthus anomalus]